MSSSATAPITVDTRAIPSWRFVAGVFVHCTVPAYVVVAPIMWLFGDRRGGAGGDIIGELLALSAWFLAGYTILAVASVVTAALIDPVSRRRRLRLEMRDPRRAALTSSRRLARAVGDGRRVLDDHSQALLVSLRQYKWDHADERFQALSNDLAKVVRTSCAALASAPPERRLALRGLATESLEHIDAALNELLAERARLDEGDAATVARYVQLRYLQSDFSSDGL
jgi:hypothetical protein